MEDYKKKYEQAMLRMNKWVEGSEIIDPKEVAEFVFLELKESEDERVRKELIDYCHERLNTTYGALPNIETIKRWLAWLEKPKYTEEDLDKAYKCADEVQYRHGYEDAKKEIEKQGEQKPADKIEPKFKVGDWIVSETSNLVYRVDSILFPQSKCYYLSYNGGTVLVNFTDEKNYHLWTIQDAKDGDVLATDERGICIFDGTVEEGKYPFAYCGITERGFEVYDRRLPFTHANVHLATKEQRELLFSKMKEAGYEWDAEKKELKKMEQEQTELPNGEDYGIDSLYHAARILEKTLGDVEGYQSDDGILEHKCAIEAVKRLYKQKPAWIEEDEIGLSNAMWAIEQARTIAKDENDMGNLWHAGWWLKSIKERMKGE